jgi:hypothetical protein
MTEFNPEPVLNEYIERVPVAREAASTDPLFQAHMKWLDQFLRQAVPAMRREGLDRFACDRVVNTVVYGAPEPDAAIERVADRNAKLEALRWATPALGLDAEAAKLLGAEWVHALGDILTAADPEPPRGTVVRDDCGILWQNDGPRYRPACWTQVDAEVHDPETWRKIAGNYGPVTVTHVPGARQ